MTSWGGTVEDLLTLREAAESLGIAPATLRQAIARGSFVARKFGTVWITTQPEVARYRAARRLHRSLYGSDPE